MEKFKEQMKEVSGRSHLTSSGRAAQKIPASQKILN